MKHFEYDVILAVRSNGNYIRDEKTHFAIERKTLTKRGHVMIDPFEADLQNQQMNRTKRFYELDEADPYNKGIIESDKEERKTLFEQAKELGIVVPKNIGTDKLRLKVETKKEQS